MTRKNSLSRDLTNIHIEHLWAEHIVLTQYPPDDPIHSSLAFRLVEQAAVEPSHETTNVGAWRSKVSSELWQGVAATLLPRVLDAVRVAGQSAGEHKMLDYLVEGWGVVYGDRGYQLIHRHNGVDWVAIYYLLADGLSMSQGDLVLFSTSSNGQSTSTEFRVTPCTGLLIVFPGHVLHAVRPLPTSGAQRVCIAMNLGVSDD
jgi:hypothetical protein